MNDLTISITSSRESQRVHESYLRELERMKEQLSKGRAVTNRQLFKHLTFVPKSSPRTVNVSEVAAAKFASIGGRSRSAPNGRTSFFGYESKGAKNVMNIEVPIEKKSQIALEEERERTLRFHRLKAEERRRKTLEEEARAAREEREWKLRRMQEFKDSRKREKDKERARLAEMERMKALKTKAEEFDRVRLLRTRGWWPWREFMRNEE